MKRILPALSAAAIAAAAFATPANALDPSETDAVKVGALDCVVEGGGSFIFGSSRDLSCTFTPYGESPGPKEIYVGTIDKFGVDLGVTGTTLMHWDVVAPADVAYAPGQLAGNYIGATASASFAAGLGANVLIGGSDDTLALQPVSVQAQEGVNVAAGIAQLTLVGAQG